MFAGDDYSIWPGYIFMRVFAIRCGMESTAVVTETMRVEETLKFNIYSDYLYAIFFASLLFLAG